MFSPLNQPDFTPRFITEQDFATYGKFTGTATSAQIQIAFTIAERQVEEELGTYLFTKQITDEVSNFKINKRIYLPVGRIRSVDSVIFHRRDNENNVYLISGFGIIDDDFFGIVRLNISPFDTSSPAGCDGCFVGAMGAGIYKAEVTYTAGYETGIAQVPMLMMGLCEAADLVLKTIRDEGELADEAHQFIKNYSIGRYQQTVDSRWARPTRFGWSGKAQFIANLIDPFRVKRAHLLR